MNLNAIQVLVVSTSSTSNNAEDIAKKTAISEGCYVARYTLLIQGIP